MRILGVDPGLRATGYGVVESRGRQLRWLGGGVVRSRRDDPVERRLVAIHDGIRDILARFRPDQVAVESLFHARNVSAALRLGHVRGVILLAAGSARLPLAEYSPLEVKQAVVGTGQAEKRQVQEMVRVLLGLEARPRPADLADALAVAICHASHLATRKRILPPVV
jgi:crossover junction endodeoxyribonuclease RuvC